MGNWTREHMYWKLWAKIMLFQVDDKAENTILYIIHKTTYVLLAQDILCLYLVSEYNY